MFCICFASISTKMKNRMNINWLSRIDIVNIDINGNFQSIMFQCCILNLILISHKDMWMPLFQKKRDFIKVCKRSRFDQDNSEWKNTVRHLLPLHCNSGFALFLCKVLIKFETQWQFWHLLGVRIPKHPLHYYCYYYYYQNLQNWQDKERIFLSHPKSSQCARLGKCSIHAEFGEVLAETFEVKDNGFHSKYWLLFNFLLTLQKSSLIFNLEYPSHFFIKFKDQGQLWNLLFMRNFMQH